MIYELRTYVPMKGREAELIDRFRSGTLKIFSRRGYAVRDFWISEQSSEIVYVMMWESAHQMQEEWARFREDAEWKQLKTATEANGPIVERIVSNVLVRPPYFHPHADGVS
jgi:heme-degrading monooxygenase HmoA